MRFAVRICSSYYDWEFESAEQLESAYEDVKNLNCTFVSMVKKISVEMIGNNEESVVIIEKDLE